MTAEFDFELHEDFRLSRGAIDSQAWVLNNVHNRDLPEFAGLLKAAREDAEKGRAALDRIEARFR